MPIEVIQTKIAEVLLVKPRVFEDKRGFFFESFNKRDWLDATGIDCDFVQENHSRSTKGILRGLHYQLSPMAQGKLVRCVVGEVFDVAVDIRKKSPTFGQWVGFHLSAENKRQIWVPAGFAHGFLVVSGVAEVLYKTTNYYAPEFERAIVWNDKDLEIDWPCMGKPILSDKDANACFLTHAELVESD